MKTILIIPVFNHATKVARVISLVQAQLSTLSGISELLVINDGSTDETARVLEQIESIRVIQQTRNRGKGQALRTAFADAFQRGFTHALTIDADGQHDAGDIAPIMAAAVKHPNDLVIGHRDMNQPGVVVPTRSKRGRDAATFWLRIQTGQRIPDSQCGLRVYPLASVLALPYRFGRFDFETEILARLAWSGLTVRSVPIRCIYFTGADRISHFRPIIDTLRGIRVNVFLVCRRLIPLPFPRLIDSTHEPLLVGKWWKWLTWRRILGMAMEAGTSNTEIAIAFALGVFVGLTPLYGLQTLLAVYFARRLHLNIPAVLLGTQISIPPLVPVWMFLSYGVGNYLLHGRWIALTGSAKELLWSADVVPAFLLGDLLVALTVAITALFVVRMLLMRFRLNA